MKRKVLIIIAATAITALVISFVKIKITSYND